MVHTFEAVFRKMILSHFPSIKLLNEALIQNFLVKFLVIFYVQKLDVFIVLLQVMSFNCNLYFI